MSDDAKYSVFDFADIGRRLREKERATITPTEPRWWCDRCQTEFGQDQLVQYTRNYHNIYNGGCGSLAHLSCDTCGNRGWIDESLGGPPTAGWVVCADCNNPFGKDAP